MTRPRRRPRRARTVALRKSLVSRQFQNAIGRLSAISVVRLPRGRFRIRCAREHESMAGAAHAPVPAAFPI